MVLLGRLPLPGLPLPLLLLFLVLPPRGMMVRETTVLLCTEEEGLELVVLCMEEEDRETSCGKWGGLEEKKGEDSELLEGKQEEGELGMEGGGQSHMQGSLAGESASVVGLNE